MKSLCPKYSLVLKEHPHKASWCIQLAEQPSHTGDFPLVSGFTTNQRTHLRCETRNKSSHWTETPLLFLQFRHITWICKKNWSELLKKTFMQRSVFLLQGTSAWTRPWNMTKLQGAVLPSATTNKLITLGSLNEEDKCRDFSSCEKMGLIFGCWKELLMWSVRIRIELLEAIYTLPKPLSDKNKEPYVAGFQTCFNLLLEDIKFWVCLSLSNASVDYKFYVCNMFLTDVLSGHFASNHRLQQTRCKRGNSSVLRNYSLCHSFPLLVLL